MRRTASLDTVYLKGQWPKDPSGPLQVEKFIQVRHRGELMQAALIELDH